MRALLIALALALTSTSALAEVSCPFVDVENPGFSISFNEDSNPIVTVDGTSKTYESSSGGTGVSSRGAFDPDSNLDVAYTYEVHEYAGKRFLVFGPDLLVETCPTPQ